MKKKELKDNNRELSYTIEALAGEIESLEEIIESKNSKLWEIIQENDRLTLTYEPYRPPGDENEDLDFYGLVEENDSLTKTILDKMEVIKEQDQKIWNLEYKIRQLEKSLTEMKPVEKSKKLRIKNERWWNFSIELWPGAWGLNYYRYNWKKYNGNSREGQMQIGPFGFSWNREPKR